MNNNHVVRTLILHWDGVQWSSVHSPNRGAGATQLISVFAASATRAWAVGYYGVEGQFGHVFILNWDGATWVRVHAPDPGRYAQLNGVSAQTGGTWAVGSYQPAFTSRTLVERYKQGEWHQVPSPNRTGWRCPENELLSVTSASPTDAWASGWSGDPGSSTGQTRWLLHWNGAEWRSIKAPGRSEWGGSTYLSGTAALSPHIVLSVGGSYENDDSTIAAIAEWFDGHTWTGVTPLTPPGRWGTEFSAVAWSSPTTAWAVGRSLAPPPTFRPVNTLIEQWDGVSWSLAASPSPGATQNNLTGVTAAVSNAWAVGNFENRRGKLRPLILMRC